MEGHCTLSPGQGRRVLDRLTALTELIPEEWVRRSIALAGLVQKRSCVLTPEVMLWVVLAMGLFTDSPIRQVFRRCRRFHGREKIPTRSALCKARKRLGTRAIRDLFQRVVGLRCRFGDNGFYGRYRLMGIDGSLFTIPDTSTNERVFGRPKGGSSSRSQGGFPQVGKVSLVELGSHIEYRFGVRPYRIGELTAALHLVKDLTPEMLVLLDAGFFGYRLLARIYEQGTQLLIKVSSTPLLKPIEILSDGSFLAKIYPSVSQRRANRGGLTVRVLRYTLDDPQSPGAGKVHRLLTTLLDEKQHPARELILLYHERWEQELVYDEQKTHLDPRRPEKTTHLRSETPAGVVQELHALSLSHYLVRKAMFDAAEGTSMDPDRLSFSGALQIIRTRLPECSSGQATEIKRWYLNVLEEIRSETTEPRRHRINPRVIKRARCKWPTKKPQHYAQPVPTKTFAQCVVIT